MSLLGLDQPRRYGIVLARNQRVGRLARHDRDGPEQARLAPCALPPLTALLLSRCANADAATVVGVSHHGLDFDGVKVFSATMYEQRQVLGEVVTTWLAAHPSLVVRDIVVRQSSDAQFHCLSISIFYRDSPE